MAVPRAASAQSAGLMAPRRGPPRTCAFAAIALERLGYRLTMAIALGSSSA